MVIKSMNVERRISVIVEARMAYSFRKKEDDIYTGLVCLTKIKMNLKAREFGRVWD